MQHTKWGIFLLTLLIMSSNLISQSISIKSLNETEATLAINPKKNTNCLVVVRESGVKSIAPDSKGKYTSDFHYSNNNKQSQSGSGNYIVYNNSKAQDISIKDLKPGVIYIADLYSDINHIWSFSSRTQDSSPHTGIYRYENK